MTRDDPEKEALFLRFWPSLGCMVFFLLVLFLVCVPKWVCQFMIYHIKKSNPESREDFIYEFEKALDQTVCAGAFGGQHDETMSNRAGRLTKEMGVFAPWWALTTRKITHRLEENHTENSIEPLRPKNRRKHD